jgi:glycosyltransferase involved in cell wall biosynthesis
VPPGDADALARAIADLYADDKRLKRLQSSARASVLERFDWRAITAKYRTVLESAARTPVSDG